MINVIIFTVAVVLLGVFFLEFKKRSRKLPPGPNGIPVLGNLLQLGTEPHQIMHQWALKYGKLFTIYFAHKPVLVINDAAQMKQLLSMTPATKKFKTDVLAGITKGCYGVGLSDGETWVEQRHFFIKTLKQFGFGRGKTIEDGVLGEAQELSNWMENEQQKNGKVFVHEKLMQCSVSIVWAMATGQRIENQYSVIIKLLDDFLEHLQKVTKSGLIFLPALGRIAPKWTGFEDYETVLNKLHAFIDDFIQEHRESRIKGNPPRDIVDAYMEKTEICDNPDSSFYGEEGYKHLFSSIVTLLLAGGQSTGVTVNWGLFYLVLNTHVQKKLQEEIDKVLGPNRDPCLADRLSMPLAEATVLETLRLASAIPTGLFHELRESVKFEGYNLPKGMLLVPNIYHVHYDKTIWGDPESFRPERFLGEEGKRLKEFVIPFQLGKRSCPAESQTKDVIFLFMTKLLQQYTFSIDSSIKNPEEYLKSSLGFVLMPQNLPMVVTKRQG